MTAEATDIASLFRAIEKISHRLDKLEASAPASPKTRSHPSLDKFIIAEAIGEAMSSDGKEKACTLEPSGKPCDHCSMCNSRGF
jgi:hypothetical protein